MNSKHLRVSIRTTDLYLLPLALLANAAGAFSENRRPDEKAVEKIETILNDATRKTTSDNSIV